MVNDQLTSVFCFIATLIALVILQIEFTLVVSHDHQPAVNALQSQQLSQLIFVKQRNMSISYK